MRQGKVECASSRLHIIGCDLLNGGDLMQSGHVSSRDVQSVIDGEVAVDVDEAMLARDGVQRQYEEVRWRCVAQRQT